MKTKKVLLLIVATSLIFACKKKEADPVPTPVTPTPVTPTVYNVTYAQTIGNSGSGLTDFNFDTNGNDMSWGLATDGNFVYVADFGNNCVKKVDLTNNTIIGWYGFKGNVWGYHTDNVAATARFKPTRIVFKNNALYVFSRKEYTGKSMIYKFDVAATTLDTSRIIPIYSFFSATVDNNENIMFAYDDSVKIVSVAGAITRFGGKGSADGQFDFGGVLMQLQSVGDTIVMIDGGNDRIQKFSNTGMFISKLAINSNKDYLNFVVADNKYYLLEQGKLAEYSPSGTRINAYTFKNDPSGFGPGQKQFVIVGNKVVFQDGYSSRLHVYTK